MLENQKKWCHEKVEKGKKWVDSHKFHIGYGVGAAMTIVGYYIVVKIFEPKRYSIDTKHIEDGNRQGFAIRTSGIDRFGKDSNYGPWVFCYDEHDKDHLINNIDAAIRNEIGEHYRD